MPNATDSVQSVYPVRTADCPFSWIPPHHRKPPPVTKEKAKQKKMPAFYHRGTLDTTPWVDTPSNQYKTMISLGAGAGIVLRLFFFSILASHETT